MEYPALKSWLASFGFVWQLVRRVMGGWDASGGVVRKKGENGSAQSPSLHPTGLENTARPSRHSRWLELRNEPRFFHASLSFLRKRTQKRTQFRIGTNPILDETNPRTNPILGVDCTPRRSEAVPSDWNRDRWVERDPPWGNGGSIGDEASRGQGSAKWQRPGRRGSHSGG